MGNKTGITWTDVTWNVARGCTKVDEDCKFCYMYRDSFDNTRYNPLEVVKTKTVFNLPLKLKEPSKIFTCSLTDFFHEAIDSYRNEAWDIIRKCPQHTFQILTKRPERITDNTPADLLQADNIWFGTSIGSEKGKHRIYDLLKVDCKTRFISFEPLHERVDMNLDLLDLIKIHWAIIGGESGPSVYLDKKLLFKQRQSSFCGLLFNDKIREYSSKENGYVSGTVKFPNSTWLNSVNQTSFCVPPNFASDIVFKPFDHAEMGAINSDFRGNRVSFFAATELDIPFSIQQPSDISKNAYIVGEVKSCLSKAMRAGFNTGSFQTAPNSSITNSESIGNTYNRISVLIGIDECLRPSFIIGFYLPALTSNLNTIISKEFKNFMSSKVVFFSQLLSSDSAFVFSNNSHINKFVMEYFNDQSYEKYSVLFKGNETGKYRYRPCQVEWMEELVKDLTPTTAIFVKQMGTHLAKELKMSDRHGGNIAEFPSTLQIREFPKGIL